jgi:hypothetical protein
MTVTNASGFKSGHPTLARLRITRRTSVDPHWGHRTAVGGVLSSVFVVNCHSAVHSMRNLRPIPGMSPAALEDDRWHRHPRHAGEKYSSKADVVPPCNGPLPVEFGPRLSPWLVTPLAVGDAFVLSEDARR